MKIHSQILNEASIHIYIYKEDLLGGKLTLIIRKKEEEK